MDVVQTTHLLKDKDVKMACKILMHTQETLHMRITQTDHNKTAKLQFKPMTDLENVDFDSVSLTRKDCWLVVISGDHESRKLETFQKKTLTDRSMCKGGLLVLHTITILGWTLDG